MATASPLSDRLNPESIRRDQPAARHHLRHENPMATKLDKAIKRELELDGKTYTVVISPEGIKITVKGFRKGSETLWRTLLPTGDGE
jgi:hypothetical protein